MELSSHTSWLHGLAEASQLVLSAEGRTLERYENYLSHGERWGTTFLLDASQHNQFIRPYFGLCNPLIMAALEQPLDVDAGIEFLRQIAKYMELRDRDAIICYSQRPNEASKNGYYEYCTAVPHSDPRLGSRHSRWIKQRPGNSVRSNTTSLCQHECHKASQSQPQMPRGLVDVGLDYRVRMIQGRDEHCFILDEGSLHTRVILLPHSSQMKKQYLVWEQPPPLFRTDWAQSHSYSSAINHEDGCTCFEPENTSSQDSLGLVDDESQASNVTFVRFTGSRSGLNDTFELYIRRYADLRRQQSVHSDKFNTAKGLTVKPSAGLEWLQKSRPQPARLWDYIESIASPMSTSPELVIREEVKTPDGFDWEFTHGRAASLIKSIMPPPHKLWLRSLELLGVASEIYKGLSGATISLNVLEYPLYDAYWAALDNVSSDSTHGNKLYRGSGELLDAMGRKEIMSCIALMETGVSNIEPVGLEEVMAMSYSNSIFVAASLLSDPYDSSQEHKVRHITGNVGHAGLNLMVSPPGQLLVRRPLNEVQTPRASSTFNGQRKNSFTGTSLHLSFTGQRLPLVSIDMDTIDQGIFYLQSVVSLWDSGKHIADLNVLGMEREHLTRIKLDCKCASPRLHPQDDDLRSLDTWRDILLPPRRTALMRAHGNWSARLAAVALLFQQHKGYSVGVLSPETLCWACLETQFTDPEPHMPQILID